LRKVALAAALVVAAAQPAPDEAGLRIYRDGVLPSGRPLRALVDGDVELAGPRAACANCHGRSGFGYTEGPVIPASITGPILYRPVVIARPERETVRTEGPGTRPAYSDETLARAIRDGIDAAGRPLDRMMPRYELSEAEMAYLLAYLRSLGSLRSDGVTDSELHIGSVVTSGVPPEKRKAMLEVLQAFVETKNAGSRQETKRARARSVFMEREQRAYRTWVLHVWDLEGEPATWPAQLEERYRRQPVFALVGGIGSGSWLPVHEFCRQRELPCVLPTTDLPGSEAPDFHSLYFSEGIPLEARALARHLRDSGAAPASIAQVYRGGEAAQVAAARALARSALALGLPEPRDLRVDAADPLSADFWRGALREPAPAVLVLWLRDPDLAELGAITTSNADVAVYLSSSLVEAPGALPSGVQPRIRLVHPFALPGTLETRLRPARAWLRARGIPAGAERVQANAYFAAHAFGEAMMHLLGNFSRDYLIEKLEHQLSSLPFASIYPSTGLAAGQRNLSKGAYVVRLGTSPEPALVAESEWITP
jgi:mono/diheme cytochrome c family protein